MDGVVPAAGEGTRLRPLTADQPKGLVDVAGTPLLTHVFETLVALDVSRLVVIVGYRGEQIRAHYGAAFDGIPIEYVTQEPRRGLGDALLQAAPQIDDNFLLLNGDNVIRGNMAAVPERHRETDATVTALVEEVPRARARKGAVFEREEGEITGVVEKPSDPPSRLVPRGFYAFSPAILDACRLVTPGETGEYELTDAIDLALEAGHRLEAVPFEGWCVNVNTPADCDRVRERLAGE